MYSGVCGPEHIMLAIIAISLTGVLVPKYVSKITGGLSKQEKDEISVIYLRAILYVHVPSYALLLIYNWII